MPGVALDRFFVSVLLQVCQTLLNFSVLAVSVGIARCLWGKSSPDCWTHLFKFLIFADLAL